MAALGGELLSCSWEDEWPDRLRSGVRRVLLKGGISHTEWVRRGLDVHHVVAAGLEAAEPGRMTLARWSVNVHNVVNAAIVPRSFHQSQGLHRQGFVAVVNQRLAAAEMFARALESRAGFAPARLIIVRTIQKIGNELVLRSGDAVAIALQTALQQQTAADVPSGGGRVRRSAGRTLGRGGRERANDCAGGADRGDEAVLAARRSGHPLAPICG